MEEARLPVQRLRNEVVEGITYADTYLDLLPESPDATAARTARQEAAALLEQAKEFAVTALTPADYGRAQALLEEAKERMDLCRRHIDAATGGTGFAVAVEGTNYKATPVTANGTLASQSAPIASKLNAEDIPENERGACFFCSRPARIADLTPVTIALNGHRRKVLACAEDVRIIRQGATPEVRSVAEDGGRIPWYRSTRYDPYRDYGHTQVVFMPGYGGYTPADGMLDGLMFGNMLSNPVPTAYPVFVTPYGEATADIQAAGPDTADDGQANVGSADFFGSDQNDFGGTNVGSADFADNVGGADFSGSDDTGSADFGSADFGSSDSGSSGSDFGGSDDSGGGDFGDSSDSGGGGGDY